MLKCLEHLKSMNDLQIYLTDFVKDAFSGNMAYISFGETNYISENGEKLRCIMNIVTDLSGPSDLAIRKILFRKIVTGKKYERAHRIDGPATIFAIKENYNFIITKVEFQIEGAIMSQQEHAEYVKYISFI